jgi:hemerythrin
MVMDIESFMGSWLTSHILVEDQKYARYIQGNN